MPPLTIHDKLVLVVPASSSSPFGSNLTAQFYHSLSGNMLKSNEVIATGGSASMLQHTPWWQVHHHSKEAR